MARMTLPSKNITYDSRDPRDPSFVGLAEVFRQASSYPHHFDGLTAESLNRVTDLPVGHIVFCLPMIPNVDEEWRAIVMYFMKKDGPQKGKLVARFGWVHPDCLRLWAPPRSHLKVQIHRTKERGSRMPTINIGEVDPGVRVVNDVRYGRRVLLDARWKHKCYMFTKDCTGKCEAFCKATARNDEIFAWILQFAQTAVARDLSGWIACERAVHRSLAAATILDICFQFRVDYYHASHRRSETCCQRCIHENSNSLFHELRSLPKLYNERVTPLAKALGLGQEI